MNLTRVFTREEPVAGLEISENFLRIALLELDRKTSAKKLAFFAEEPLEADVLAGGTINQPKFLASLHNLIKKLPAKVRYVVASIPSDPVYAKIFSFPKTIRGQKLEQSMKLTIGFQLPFKPEDVYLDWEKVPPHDDQNEVFLAASPKRVIDVYIEALNSQGLSPVAIEFHPLSFLRVIDIPKEKSVLIKIIGKTSAVIAVVENNTLRFSRTLPGEFIPDDKLEEETRKITDFYESEYEPIAEAKNLDEANALPAYNFPELKGQNGKWLISLGAALRGLSPRDEDARVSLLPVGTEEAYEYHKAIIFSEFIANLTIGISVFFAAAFIVVWIIMGSIKQKTLAQLEALNSLPIPSDAAALEAQAQKLNDLVGAESAAMKTIPGWSIVFGELSAAMGSGINVTNVNLPSPADMINVTALAHDRSQLDALKKRLAGSSFFADAKFSKTDLTQAANIPFSVTFRIKEPQKLYEN